MKSLFALFASLCMVALAGGVVSDAYGQSLPGGSYRDSCSDIQVRSNFGRSLWMFATCTDRQGKPVPSYVELPCTSAENDNGYLKCVAGGVKPEWVAPPLPEGSYRHSCFKLAIRKGEEDKPVLFASCTDRSGMAVESVFHLPCNGDIANDNGRLACVGNATGGAGAAPARVPPPGGSYLESCADVVVQTQPGRRGVLFAACVDKEGRRGTTSIYLPCAGKITNDDGRLRCND